MISCRCPARCLLFVCKTIAAACLALSYLPTATHVLAVSFAAESRSFGDIANKSKVTEVRHSNIVTRSTSAAYMRAIAIAYDIMSGR